MSSWFWVICPKCGSMMDSDFMYIEPDKEEICHTAKEYKEVNKESSVCCDFCDKDFHIGIAKVVSDDDL